MRLDQLHIHEKARITELSDSSIASRLADLGFFIGQTVEIVLVSPLKDPIAVKAGNTTVSLRLNEAELVNVEKI